MASGQLSRTTHGVQGQGADLAVVRLGVRDQTLRDNLGNLEPQLLGTRIWFNAILLWNTLWRVPTERGLSLSTYIVLVFVLFVVV